MHLSAGLLGQQSARLLTTLLVVQSLKLATSGVTHVQLSVDVPPFVAGGLAIVANSTYPLFGIVTCSNGLLTASVSEIFAFGSDTLRVQFEENSNEPDQFFVLPNSTGTVDDPEGEYEITLSCHNQTLAETAAIAVSIYSAEDSPLPYFTDSPRYLRISSSAPPKTVIATYKAKVSGVHLVLVIHEAWVVCSEGFTDDKCLPACLGWCKKTGLCEDR